MSQETAFSGFLKALNDGLCQSYWFDVTEANHDEKKPAKLITIQQYSGLNATNYEAFGLGLGMDSWFGIDTMNCWNKFGVVRLGNDGVKLTCQRKISNQSDLTSLDKL